MRDTARLASEAKFHTPAHGPTRVNLLAAKRRKVEPPTRPSVRKLHLYEDKRSWRGSVAIDALPMRCNAPMTPIGLP